MGAESVLVLIGRARETSGVTEVATPPPPDVVGPPQEIAPGVHVIPDRRVPLVPNIGIVLGDEKALVVDTGIGPENGHRVRALADELASERELLLTITHFHPEHGFGAQAFADARIVYNAAQREEFLAKGSVYLEMFRTFGDTVAAALEGVELVEPGEVYEGDAMTLDLGGRSVELLTWGQAHTLGDQVVFLPEDRVLFAGDLVEERCFAILPYFPPDDTDVDGDKWIAVLERLEALDPEIVVPGHGGVGGVSIIRDAREYLTSLRDETRRRKTAGLSVDTAVEEIDAQMRALHPDWLQPEWIGFGVRHFYDAG
jgi:glyoxylase-like metal-dependent hydrolase (beta-lactamase superfamily II)